MRKILLVATIAILCSCEQINMQDKFEPSSRFTMEQHDIDKHRGVFVLTDHETGEEYLLMYGGFGGVAVVPKTLPSKPR